MNKENPFPGWFSKYFPSKQQKRYGNLLEKDSALSMRPEGETAHEDRFRAIYENAPIMIDAFSSDGRCLLWNHECEKQLGFTKEEMLAHRRPLSMVYPDGNISEEVLRVIMQKDGKFREFCVKAKDGTTRYQMWANYGLADNTAICVGYDITQQKLSEHRLAKVNQCFLEFGPSPKDNINRLVKLCGELLGADAALYNRLIGEVLYTIGLWNMPPDFQLVHKAQ